MDRLRGGLIENGRKAPRRCHLVQSFLSSAPSILSFPTSFHLFACDHRDEVFKTVAID